MTKRGIVLAGGLGTRLWPMTRAVSKQLVPVYDKPMVYYPISTLLLSGVTDFLIITTEQDLESYQKLLLDGSQWGVRISYRTQAKPSGIAEAVILAEDFTHGEPFALILGDNFLYGVGMGRNFSNLFSGKGATITAFKVADPSDLGVVVFNEDGTPTELIEKPQEFVSDWAVPGIYFYDGTAAARAKELKPSSRGELEITDLNRSYMDDESLRVHKLPRGTSWLDLGTTLGILEASQFVHVLQERQGLLVGSPDEIAVNLGLISKESAIKRLTSFPSNYSLQILKNISN
jgi:glucose-1-phosphate thymidylyltransferase